MSDTEFTAADVVDGIVNGNPMAAKTAFDALVTARVGEKIEELRPDIAASLFDPVEEDEDLDSQEDSEEEELDDDQLQSDEE